MDIRAGIKGWRHRADNAYLRWAKTRVWRAFHRSWLLQFAALGVAFALLHDLFYKFAKYKEPVFLDGFMLDGAFAKPRPVVTLLILYVWLALFHKRLKWKRLGGKWVRWAIPVLILMSVWGVALTGFNYFTNQLYLADRILIVALLLLTFRWPVFAAPLLGYLLMFLGQQRLSAGDLELTDKFPLFDVQIAFIAWLVLRTALPVRLRAFLWFLIALQAINYLAPGIAKLTLGDEFKPFYWARHNPLHILVASGHVHGWFYWMSRESVESIVRFASWFTPVMAAFTLFVELGSGILSLWRRTAPWILLAAILMHLGILSLTGIFFWKWILLDAALIWGIRRSRALPSRKRSLMRVGAMVILIACFPLYAKPKWLGWIDSRVCEHYMFEVEGADGRTYRVDQADMSPFDITFEQGVFHYINEEPVVTNSWGNVQSYELGGDINSVTTPARVREMIRQRGEVLFDKKKTAELDRYLRQYFRHVNQRRGEVRWVNWLGPPTHVQVRSGGQHYDFETPARTVKIRFVRTFYDGERLVTLDDRLIREVEIPDS